MRGDCVAPWGPSEVVALHDQPPCQSPHVVVAVTVTSVGRARPEASSSVGGAGPGEGPAPAEELGGGGVQGPRESETPPREGKRGAEAAPSVSSEPVETEPVGPPAEEQDEEQDRPPLATEAPPTVGAEASDPREARPPSLAPEGPRFSVPRVSGSPAATSPAASSLAPEEPTSPTTAAPRSRGSAVPWVPATPALLPQEDEPGALPRSTRVPVPSATEGARGTSACPTGEVSAPLDPARPLPGLPGDSAPGGALALRAPRPGAEGPGMPGGEPRHSAGHAWAPALALLLLPAPLLWAGPL